MTRQPTDSRGAASAGDIARRIQRMTHLVRNASRDLMALRPDVAQMLPEVVPQPRAGRRTQGQAETGAQLGWWVLAQGRQLDPEDFASREAAREELLTSVRQAGVLVGENVWVWDETGRAQLVLSTLPSLDRARRVAERLRGKGLSVVVRRAMP